MKVRNVAPILLIMLFLIPANSTMYDPKENVTEASPLPSDFARTLSEGQPAYADTGTSRTATLQGLTTNTSAGPLHIDSLSSEYGYVDVPTGWTGTDLRADIDHSSTWDNDVLTNADLGAYHSEVWPDTGTTTTFSVPDDWTLIKNENAVSGDPHPTLGIMELNRFAAEGYSGDSGWEFEAQYSDGATLAATDEVYLRQLIGLPRQALYSIDISFLYYVDSATNLQNQTYMFIRVGDYEQKFFIHESGDTTNTWILVELSIPSINFESVTTPTSIAFDIGISTDLSGVQATGYSSWFRIDEIRVDCETSPFAEQIDLKANSTSIGVMTSGSISPEVTDSANMDATDHPTNGIDLNGLLNDGHLYVGVRTGYVTWESGFQFPVSIPQGAVITSAYLEVESAGTTGSFADMRLQLAAEDDVSAFSTGLPHLEDTYSWNNATIDWDVTAWTADTRYSSPDFTDLFQSVIGRPGWSSGNDVCIMLKYMYSSVDNRVNHIKGTSNYNTGDLAKLFVTYLVPVDDTVSLSGSWTSPDVGVEFTTNSSTDVIIESSLYLNITDSVSTLDNSMVTGTSFSVDNNTAVDWTANLLVSPPTGVTDVNVSLSKPSTWTLQTITDPDGDARTGEATTTSTTVTLSSSVVDVNGVWVFEFTESNAASNLQMRAGADPYDTTGTFDVADSLSFKGTASSIGGSAMRLILTDPTGSVFYAADDLTQSTNDFDWTSISVTSSWPAGVWYADVHFNDTAGAIPTVVGKYQRSFIVKHDTSLELQSPGDAIGDLLSVRTAGDMLYVEVKLVDDDNSAAVTGSTVSMNWTVLGVPTDVPLEDFGTGYYGVTLNTSDLEDAKRWRIDISSSHQYYNDATLYFDLDLSHETEITYETPSTQPYGSDSTLTLYVNDAFNGTPIPGATITTNGTIVGGVTDNGDGSYSLTLDTDTLAIGTYGYEFNATPSETYLLASSVDIIFTIREIQTAIYGVGGDSVTTEYNHATSTTITFNDTDHSHIGITGASDSIQTPIGIGVVVTEGTNGAYSVAIDPGTKLPGTYLINITLSKTNYESRIIQLSLVIEPHDTYVIVNYDSVIPWGVDSSFVVTWYDADEGNVELTGNLDNITVGAQSFGTFSFDLVTNALAVGSYQYNLTLYSSSTIYRAATMLVNVTVRAHYTTVQVTGEFTTPYGSTTSITVVYWDVDTDSAIAVANVNQMTFSPTSYGDQVFGDSTYSITLDTSVWALGTDPVTLTVTSDSSNLNYEQATTDFDVVIRAHYTTVTINAAPVTPWGVDSVIIVTYWDSDLDAAIPLASVNQFAFTPAGHSVQNFGDSSYTITVDTSPWTVAVVSTQLDVTSDGGIYETASITFDITIRAHHTTVTAVVDDATPWGFNTGVTVTLWDTDTDTEVPIANVTSITYTPSGHGAQNPAGYSPTLTTDTWDVAIVSTGIAVVCVGTNQFYDAASNSFDITVRAHHTTVTAVVDNTTPWGFNTGVTVIFWDADTDSAVPIANVTSITYTPSGYGAQSPAGYTPTLATNTWTVGIESTSISVICVNTNKYYDTASNTFDISIRAHHTTVTAVVDKTTPWGFNTGVTVIFWDADTDSQVPITNVTSITYTPSGHGAQSPAGYTPTLTTDTWDVGIVSTGIAVVCVGTNQFYDTASNTFDITIRAHNTTVTAVVDDSTPWGFNTPVTVTLWDVDTDSQVPITNVTSITYTPSGYGAQSPVGYTPTLSTNTWPVSVVSTGISVTCVGTNEFYDAASNSFDITIRAHQTTVHVEGNFNTPYGELTSVTVVYWDLDVGAVVPLASVNQMDFNPASYSNQLKDDSSYTISLDTSGWALSTESVTLTVTSDSSNLNYTQAVTSFDVVIRAHYTTVTINAAPITPWGYDSVIIVTYWDSDLDVAVPLASVNQFTFTPAGHGVQNFGDLSYTITIDTDLWAVAVSSTQLDVTSDSGFYETASITFDITIRAHQTTVHVEGDFDTPRGQTTGVTVVYWDLDNDSAIAVANVNQMTFAPSGYSNQVFGDSTYSITLDSSSFTISTVSVTLTVTSDSANLNYTQAITSFDVVIRAHHTTVTINTAPVTPWGSDSAITITYWDTDLDAAIPVASVNQFTITPTGQGVQNFGDSSYTLTIVTNTWTVSVVSTQLDVTSDSGYYDAASINFDITIRAHYTTVTAVVDSATPWGYNTPVTVTFWDTDTDSVVPTANVTSITYSPAGHSAQNPAGYSPILTTDTWTVGAVSTGISVVCVGSNEFYDAASSSFDITIRAHQTTVTAVVDASTPWGSNTYVAITFWDSDTDSQVPIANVTSITYTPSGHGAQSPAGYSPTLTTDTWTVGVVSTGISVVCAGTNEFYDAATGTFYITIRAHRTSVSVSGGLTSPYGNDTPVTVIYWDLDLDVEVPIANVTNLEFNPSGYSIQNSVAYPTLLTTSTWSVGTTSITLTATCVSANLYYDSAAYTFVVTIASLGTGLSHEPTDMIIPSGDNFTIVLNVLVSESGNQYDNDTIDGLVLAEFSAKNSTYTFPIEITALGNGQYELLIEAQYLTDDDYSITIYVNPSNTTISSASLFIHFSYRDARSGLTSPTSAEFSTAFQTDITVLLNYTDIDRSIGIIGAAITNESINISWLEQGNGIYEVTIIVANLAKGDHTFNLTASAAQYESKTLTFTLTIRIAYTSAIPTVGALDIPIGNDPIFYVEYLDTDHDVAITSESPFAIQTTWNHSITWVWEAAQERYKITFPTFETDDLVQNYVITFNFSKGENYQFGIFNISITLRTHNTDFRLVSAVDPTSYNSIINISVYYGDLDNALGIKSKYIAVDVWNTTRQVTVLGYDNDTALGDGYYIIRLSASQFRQGQQTFTVYFNWTGAVYQYQNKTLIATANIIGEDSKLTLLIASAPTYYLGNMSYTFEYAELYSGLGITNSTYDVHIYVTFQGESVDIAQVDIWEVDPSGQPGNYSLRFNTTLFGHTGTIYMNVYINWTEGASPFYTNRADVITIKILSRDTLVSIVPPSPTAWGENATFTFSYDDVTGAGSEPIENDAKLSISLSIGDYTLTYNATTKIFTISFNTSQSPVGDEPLGLKSFTLTVNWAGAPYYTNHTAISISITTIERQTVLRFDSPAPTSYQENVTFIVTWTDVAGATVRNLTGADIELYDDTVLIPLQYYSVRELGEGRYEIELNTTYYASPGTYSLKVSLSLPSEFYVFDIEASRNFVVQYRISLLSSEPINEVAFNSSIVIIVNYQDLIAAGLPVIGNDSGKVHLEILNGTDWEFTVEWKPAFEYYIVTIQTYNKISALTINVPYVLRLNMSYNDEAPFHRWDDAYINFEFRERNSELSVSIAPEDIPYPNTANFSIFFEDLEDSSGIIALNTSISIFKGVTELLVGVNYTISTTVTGYWNISLQSTSLDGLGITAITIYAYWGGKPYHSNETLVLDIVIIQRPTTIEIVDAANQAQYLDDITFSFRFIDDDSNSTITLLVSYISFYNGTHFLTQGVDYIVTSGPGDEYTITINSVVVSSILVTNKPYTIIVDWPGTIAPYYDDNSYIIKLTSINRLGSVAIGQVSATPVGDLMNITFSFNDQDTTAGIENAIIIFSCIDVPSLVEGVDYWINGGTGSTAGNYFILIDTLSLGSIAPESQLSFNFSLGIQWDSAIQPYYLNATTLKVSGAVRLIWIAMTPGAADPSNAPLNDIVSVNITLTDSDNSLAILGLGSDISVVYESTGLAPDSWSFVELGNGVYTISVDTSDAGSPGTKRITISFTSYPYQEATAEVQFQTRLRIAIIQEFVIPSIIYAGDDTYLILNLTDSDAGGAAVSQATVTVAWAGGDSTLDLLNGRYNITLTTSSLDYGYYTLIVDMTLQNYTIQLYSTSVNLLPVTTDLNPVSDEETLYWGESSTITVYFEDTVHTVPIDGATVSYTWTGAPGNFVPTGTPGYYEITLDSSNVDATTVIVTIKANKTNFISLNTQVTLIISPLPVEITPADGQFSISLDRGAPAFVRLYLNDTVNNDSIDLAAVSYSWRFGSGNVISETGGFYSTGLITELADVGSYTVLIIASKNNYLIAPMTLTIIIKQTAVVIDFIPGNETIADNTYYWSQELYVGVWVYAPQITNITERYRTDAHAQWQLLSSGAVVDSGWLNNGTDIGQDGFFWFTFVPEIAGTFTLKISISPANQAYAANITRATISVRNIQTTVIEPDAVPLIWGGSYWFNFTYTDVDRNIGVDDAVAQYYWAGETEGNYATYFGDGKYGILLQTQLVRPSTFPYPITVSFAKPNFDSKAPIIYIDIKEIPTESVVYSPSANHIANNSETLQVPVGDILSINLFYNATATLDQTPFVGGIAGATVSINPAFLELAYIDDGNGNYTIIFDSSEYTIQESFVITVTFTSENRSSIIQTISITIIEIQTAMEFVDIAKGFVEIYSGSPLTVSIHYWDNWRTHNAAGITNARVRIQWTVGDSLLLENTSITTESDGYYTIHFIANPPLFPVGIENETIILSISLTKGNYSSGDLQLTVVIMPTETQSTLSLSVTYGLPSGIIIMMLLFLWVRVFSVPKRLRQINGQIKSLSKGRVPKPIEEAKGRGELVADLFNDTYAALEITRVASQMPSEAVMVEVPEMGELLIQLSILTNLSPEELDEFKADISKMKMSEQAAFVKEVIHQEAIRAARRDGKTIETVLEEVQRDALQRLSGDEISAKAGLVTTADEPVILMAEDVEELPVKDEPKSETDTIVDDIRREEPVVKSDRMSEYEIEELRKELVDKGIPPHEIDTILEQAKSLPRDLVEELIKSLES